MTELQAASVAGPKLSALSWQWAQNWRDVFFAHWRVPERSLTPHLPANVEPQICDGAAWISAVAFDLTTRLHGWPAVPWCSRLLELNLRTYIEHRGEPAVLFLRMYGGRRLAVWLGRRLTPLPYSFASARYDQAGPVKRFACAQGGRELFAAEFCPINEPRPLAADSLDAWLVERYGAIVPGANGRLFRMTVRHPPWFVQPAAARVEAFGLGQRIGVDLGRPPDIVHFSAGVAATVGRFEIIAPEA